MLAGRTPYYSLYNAHPDYEFLKVFGCECFPLLTINLPHKLAPKSVHCVFIGYASNYKGYRCLDPSTGQVYTSRHVRFHKNVFPFKLLCKSHAQMPTTLVNSMPPIVTHEPLVSDESPTLQHYLSPHPVMRHGVLLPGMFHVPGPSSPTQ